MLDRVEDGHQRRAGQNSIGKVQRIGVCGAKRLQQTNHVVTEHPEQTRSHRRQIGGQVELAGRDQGAQRVQSRKGFGGKGVGEDVIAARDVCLTVTAAPHSIGRQGDDGIAAIDRAAFDRLQKAGIGTPVSNLEEGRYGRLHIVDEAADQQLGLTRCTLRTRHIT